MPVVGGPHRGRNQPYRYHSIWRDAWLWVWSRIRGFHYMDRYGRPR